MEPRREPHWYKLGRDRHLGYRKLTSRSAGTWIARYRDGDGDRFFRSLGECSDQFGFDAAKAAAEAWFRDQDQGISGRDEAGEVPTVASACRAYVRSLMAEGRHGTAHDAHMRFRRTIYGTAADGEFGPKSRGRPEEPGVPMTRERGEFSEASHPQAKHSPHGVAALSLVRVSAPRLRQWHLELVSGGLSKASANRTLTALKAALNLAVANRLVGVAAAREWADVQPLKGASARRELFLDVMERRALLLQAEGAVRDLIEAVIHTGCRAGELVSARRSAFDSRTQSLSVNGKTGPRTIPLTAAATEFFARCARHKLPSAFLLTRDDGMPWAHSDWDELVRAAASRACLPRGTCLYALRHSFITQALLDGVSTLEVAKIVGTSLAMIEKHYGHLVQSTARERLARVQMI